MLHFLSNWTATSPDEMIPSVIEHEDNNCDIDLGDHKISNSFEFQQDSHAAAGEQRLVRPDDTNLSSDVLLQKSEFIGAMDDVLVSKKKVDNVAIPSFRNVDDQIETLWEENNTLKAKCKDLEDLIFDSRQENDLYKVKMILAIGGLRSKLDSLNEDKECLEEKCGQLGRQLYSLRESYKLRLDQIASLERDLRDNHIEYDEDESLDIGDIIPEIEQSS